ncbi:MAG: energy-coupled thiamine transporter ThiT [Clostridia bacterium]|nr:energy-coupled thiamine transporter ThiT [Clostridia bacterium]
MKTKRLVISAMLIAIATVLSVFQPFQLPFGGGITIASMLPIVLIAFTYGTRWGLFSAFIFSLLQLLLGAKTVSAFFLPGEDQMTLWKALSVCILDYIVAYTVLGFGGILKNKMKHKTTAICLGSVIALSLRYVVHIVSGALFFGAWAEWFFTQEGFYAIGEKIMETFSGNTLALIYSVFYNGTYMLPEIIITAILTPIIYKTLTVSGALQNTES